MRRSKFIAEEDFHGGELIRQEDIVDTRDRGRRFVGQKTKEELMWTEITKDLVIKDAIEEMGYDYEETEFFFYVMVYLRYVSLLPSSKPFPLLNLCRNLLITYPPQLGGCPPPRRANRIHQT